MIEVTAGGTPLLCPSCGAAAAGRNADPCPQCGAFMFAEGTVRPVCSHCRLPAMLTGNGWQHAELADAMFCFHVMRRGDRW